MTNRIICGDTRNILSTFPDSCIDLTVTSPPYNVGKDYDNWMDSMSEDEYRELLVIVTKELYRVTKRGGRLCLNVPMVGNSWFKQPKGAGLMFYPFLYNEIAVGAGWIFREFIVWHKVSERDTSNFAGNSTAWGSWLSPSNPYCRSFSEAILIYHKEIPELQHTGQTDLTKNEFLEYTKSGWFFFPENRFMKDHPAPYPEELPKRCIKLYTYIGDVVLDPFCGTGTTCLVASRLNRKYVGIDISPKYCKITKQRLSAVQMELFQ